MAWNKESTAARRARVAKQLRDKHGKWIEMGGGVKWFKDGAWHNGTASAFEGSDVVVKMADGSEQRINHRQIEPIRAKGKLGEKPAKPNGSVQAKKSKNDKGAGTVSIKDNDPGKRLTTNAKDLEEGDEVHLVGKDSPRFSISDKDAEGLEDTGFDVNVDDKKSPVRARVVDTSGDRVVVEDSAGKRHEISKNDNVLADDPEVDAALQNADEKGQTLGDVLPDEMRAMPNGTELDTGNGTTFRKEGKDSWQRLNSDGQNAGSPSTSAFLHQNLENKDAEFLSKKEAAEKFPNRKGGEAPKGEDISLDAPKNKEGLTKDDTHLPLDGLELTDAEKAHINSAETGEEALKRLAESEAGQTYAEARKINSEASKKFVAAYRKASKDIADKHEVGKNQEEAPKAEEAPKSNGGTPLEALQKSVANLSEDLAEIDSQELDAEAEAAALKEAAYDFKSDDGEVFNLTGSRDETGDWQLDITDSDNNPVASLNPKDSKSPQALAQAIKDSTKDNSSAEESEAPTEAPETPAEEEKEAPKAEIPDEAPEESEEATSPKSDVPSENLDSPETRDAVRALVKDAFENNNGKTESIDLGNGKSLEVTKSYDPKNRDEVSAANFYVRPTEDVGNTSKVIDRAGGQKVSRKTGEAGVDEAIDGVVQQVKIGERKAKEAEDKKAAEAPTEKDATEPGTRENLDKALKDAGFSDDEVKAIGDAASTDESEADKQFFQSETGQANNVEPSEKFKAARKALDDFMKANNENVQGQNEKSDQTRADSAGEKARADELDSPEAVARGAKETIDSGKQRDEDRAAKNTDEAKLAEIDRKIGVGEKMLADAEAKENAPLVKRLSENLAALKKQREKMAPITEEAGPDEATATGFTPGTQFDVPEGGVPILSNKKLEKKTADFLKNGDKFFAQVDEKGNLRPVMGNDLRATPDGEPYEITGVNKTSSKTSITAKDSKGKLHLFEFGVGDRKKNVVLDTQKNREGLGLTDKSKEAKAPEAPAEKKEPAPRSAKAPLSQEMLDNLPDGARTYARNTENKSMGYYRKKDGEWFKEKNESNGPVDLPDSAKLFSTPTGDMTFHPFSGETASLESQDIISVTMPDGTEARAIVDKVDVKNQKAVARVMGARGEAGLEDIATDRIQSLHRLKDDDTFYSHAGDRGDSVRNQADEDTKEEPTAEDMGEEVAPEEVVDPTLNEPAPGDEDVPEEELEVPAEKDPEEEKLAEDFIAENPEETQDASEGPTREEIQSTVEEALSDIDDDLEEFGGDANWMDISLREWPIVGKGQHIAVGARSTDEDRFLGLYDSTTGEELETFDMEGNSTDGPADGNTDDTGAGDGGGDDSRGGDVPSGDGPDSGTGNGDGESSGGDSVDPAEYDARADKIVRAVTKGLIDPGENVQLDDEYSVEYDVDMYGKETYRLYDSNDRTLIKIARKNEDRLGEILRGYSDADRKLHEAFSTEAGSDGRRVTPTRQMQRMADIGTYFENDRGDRFTKITAYSWGMSKAGDNSDSKTMGIIEGHGRFGSGEMTLGHHVDHHRPHSEIEAMSDDELRQTIADFGNRIHGIVEVDGKIGDSPSSRGAKAQREQEMMQQFRYELYRVNDEAADYAKELWKRLRENGAHEDGKIDIGEFNSSPEIPFTNRDASIDYEQWTSVRNEYVGLDHRTLKHNFELRNSEKPSRGAVAWANKMDKWTRTGELADDFTMFRSVLASPDAATEFAPGKVVVDKGIMSLADNLHTAEVYLDARIKRTAGKIPIVMEVQGRKGEKMTAAGYGSDELVVPRGSKLFISSAEMDDQGILRVTARLNPSEAEVAEWTNKSTSDKPSAPEAAPEAPEASTPEVEAPAEAPKVPAKDGKFTQVEGFENGDRVFHAKHGAGTIVKRESNGQFARIQFDKDKDTGKVMGISLTKVTKGESAAPEAEAPKSPAKTISPRPTTVKEGSTAETGDWKTGERVNHGKHGAGTIKRLEGNGEYARVEFDGAAGTKGIKLTQLGRGDNTPAPSRPETPAKVKTPKVPKAPLATAPEGSPGQIGGWTLGDKLIHKSKGSGTLKSFGKDGTFGMIEFDNEPGVQRGIRFSGLSKADTSTPDSMEDPNTMVNGPDGEPINSGDTDTRTDGADGSTAKPVLDKTGAALYVGAVVVHPQLGRGRVVKIGTSAKPSIQVIFDNDPTGKPKSLSGARLQDIAIAPKGATDKTSL